MKIFNFYGNRTPKVWFFGPTLTPPPPPQLLLPTLWIWPKSKKAKKIKGVTSIPYHGAINCCLLNLQEVWSYHFQILRPLITKDISEKLLRGFSSFAAFLGTTATFFWKKKVPFHNAEFNVELNGPISNPKNGKRGSSYALF